MSVNINDCLCVSNHAEFSKIENIANSILMEYAQFRLIGANLKTLVKKYANKKGFCLKILYLPFHDSQVWGLYYNRNGMFFIVINSEVSLNKQNVALAHEFYHLIDSIDNDNMPKYDILKDENTKIAPEDIKANAFSSCLLMPKDMLESLLDKKPTSEQDVFGCIKLLKDVFVVPFKTVVIRLYELDLIKKDEAEALLNYKSVSEKDEFFDRWDQTFKDFVDLDGFYELLTENCDYDLISKNRELKIKKQVEEIIGKIKGILNSND